MVHIERERCQVPFTEGNRNEGEERLAIANLERNETAMIPNVLLTLAELREHWPIQFP
jgi:hypothetical protein